MNEEQKRPTFWMWGDPVTVKNPIREAWEAKQKAKKQEQFEKFLRSRKDEEDNE